MEIRFEFAPEERRKIRSREELTNQERDNRWPRQFLKVKGKEGKERKNEGANDTVGENGKIPRRGVDGAVSADLKRLYDVVSSSGEEEKNRARSRYREFVIA